MNWDSSLTNIEDRCYLKCYKEFLIFIQSIIQLNVGVFFKGTRKKLYYFGVLEKQEGSLRHFSRTKFRISLHLEEAVNKTGL